ncbi:hypothetical protein BRC92_01955 [Halobacteriales archaeon QS_4_69_31]|nr:MAG: hypothetical protein BRC92_01955 [Halobacteriales archaeon QS_4_69_31]
MASAIITLYAFGLVLIAVGAALVPVISTRVVPPKGDVEEEAAEPDTEEVLEAPESQARFELYEDRAGKYRWRLVHRNGRIMGDSGEGYASRTGAIGGIQSVKRNAEGVIQRSHTRSSLPRFAQCRLFTLRAGGYWTSLVESALRTFS